MTMDAAASTRLRSVALGAGDAIELVMAVPVLLDEIEVLRAEAIPMRLENEILRERAERAEAALLRALVDNNRVLPSTDEAGWVKQARAVLAEATSPPQGEVKP